MKSVIGVLPASSALLLALTLLSKDEIISVETDISSQ